MKDEAGGVISLLVGAMALRLAITGDHRRYVKPAMGPWLLIAGTVLVVIGGVTWYRANRRRSEQAEPHPDHGHRLGVAWLLVAPIVTLLLVAPPALGSYGVDRAVTIDVAGGELFAPLPASDQARPMTLTEFSERAYDRDGASMSGATVALTGFVADGGGNGEFRLARFTIACCAADAQAAVVRVALPEGMPPPARDAWVTVVGTYRTGRAPDEVPVLAATVTTPVDAPAEPYE